MGEFSKVELLIIEKCTEAIGSFIYALTSTQRDKDRLLYSSCLNDDEKEDYTKSEIKKMQRKLSKCNPDIAEFIRCYLSPSEFDLSGDTYDQYRDRLIKNFLITEFEDVLEVLTSKFKDGSEIENVDILFWDEIIEEGQYGIDNKFMMHFVKFMALAERLSTFRSMLEMIEKEKSKPNLDNILNKMKAQSEALKPKKIEDEFKAILDGLRDNNVSDLKLYTIIKTQTGLDKTALNYMKEEILWYLFSMKTAQEAFYTKEQLDRAILDIKSKHTEGELINLGYLKTTKMFLDYEYADPEEPIYWNKEKLLFPDEFKTIERLIAIINDNIGEEKEQEKDSKDSKSTQNLSDITNQINIDYALKLMEDLSITLNYKFNLSERKKGAIRGVIEALKESSILPNQSLTLLCDLVAKEIELQLNSKLDASNTSEEYKKKALEYIKHKPLH
ncbi:hypothetical protein [Gelatiniphilus marinus]|uniref:Uncharacterized protein n=1 Tax=Gelatiniphilus marinus TaxID=1759464 RepID=A0ABW5JYJ4_9FLAO